MEKWAIRNRKLVITVKIKLNCYEKIVQSLGSVNNFMMKMKKSRSLSVGFGDKHAGIYYQTETLIII
jgi:hypothetical protein